MRSLPLLVLVVVVVVVVPLALLPLPLLPEASIGGGEARGALAGGWRRIDDVAEAHVREIGEYAVAEYDRRTAAGLAFARVLRGETQVVAGINYRLVLEADEKGAGTGKEEQAPQAAAAAAAAAGGRNYEAVVWEKAWLGFRNLTSFRPV